MKKCPYCAEEIQDDAIKCKHCKEFLMKAEQAPFGVCKNCNSSLNINSDFCPACGVLQVSAKPELRSNVRNCHKSTNEEVIPKIDFISKPNKLISGFNRRGDMKKKTTELRLFGGAVLIFNLWLIGRYNLSGIPVLLLTFGFAIGFEYLVVRPSSKEKRDIKR